MTKSLIFLAFAILGINGAFAADREDYERRDAIFENYRQPFVLHEGRNAATKEQRETKKEKRVKQR